MPPTHFGHETLLANVCVSLGYCAFPGAAGKGGVSSARGHPGSSGEAVQVVIKDSPVILRQVCHLCVFYACPTDMYRTLEQLYTLIYNHANIQHLLS